jgi:hypothetical protein
MEGVGRSRETEKYFGLRIVVDAINFDHEPED